MESELLSYILPEGLLDFFEVTQIEKTEVLTIHLEEKNIIPVEYAGHKLTSKGFYEESTIQDFPIRKKACFLKVKRRRWLNEDTGNYVARDWKLVAKGTRMTQELASFLKGADR